MKKLVKFLCLILVSTVLLIANNDLVANKKAINSSVKKHEKELIKISDAIWHNAELAWNKLITLQRTWIWKIATRIVV